LKIACKVKRAAASFAIGGILVEWILLLPQHIQIQSSLFQIPRFIAVPSCQNFVLQDFGALREVTASG
jgi:hypothetical protein